MIEATVAVEILAIITFFVLLFSAIYMLVDFYVCDNYNCKPFNDAATTSPTGTSEYVVSLLNNTYSDGIWSIPYIGAAILTPLSLWFMRVPITVLNFAILFFISFATIYFLFAFFGHHYIIPITEYTSNWITNNPNTSSENTSSTNKEPTATINNDNEVITFNDRDDDSEIISLNDQETGVIIDNNDDDGVPLYTRWRSSKSNESKFESLSQKFNITFATPIDIYK